MAIGSEDLRWYSQSGVALPDGSLHVIFGDSTAGDGFTYYGIELRNYHASLTFGTPVAWLAQGGTGSRIAIAAVPLPNSLTTWPRDDAWPVFDAVGLSYVQPTIKATGLAFASLPPARKHLVVMRRDLTDAVAAFPESARLFVGGTSPL